jgi:EAL domain-containing protein (putative c-di-GMP-specific phosphodiesterase class I)
VARLDAHELVLVVPGHAAGWTDPVAVVAAVVSDLRFDLGLGHDAVTCCALAPTTAGGLLGQVRRVQGQLLSAGPAAGATADEDVPGPDDVVRALDRGEFRLVYQPVLDGSGAVVSIEALLRWEAPDRLILPQAFLPTLERHGLDGLVGDWVLTRALEDAAGWDHHGLDGVPVVVNVTAAQVAGGDLAGAVEAGLGRSGAPGIIVETSPRADVSDLRALRGRLTELSAAGARLSLDRVDRGAISAGLLTVMPLVEAVKLDRSVVADLQGSGRATAAALRILAGRVGTTLGATGVETAAQHDALRRLGVDVLQGYRFCPPVSLGELGLRITHLSFTRSAPVPDLPEPMAFLPAPDDEPGAVPGDADRGEADRGDDGTVGRLVASAGSVG